MFVIVGRNIDGVTVITLYSTVLDKDQSHTHTHTHTSILRHDCSESDCSLDVNTVRHFATIQCFLHLKVINHWTVV